MRGVLTGRYRSVAWSEAERSFRQLRMPVTVLVAMYLTVQAFRWYLEREGGTLTDDGRMLALPLATVVMLALYFGIARATTGHPAMDRRYRAWLRSTPWRRGVSLPQGSVMPGWADGVVAVAWCVIGVLVLAWETGAWGPRVWWVGSGVTAVTIAVGYMAGAMGVLAMSRRAGEALAVGVLLGLMVRVVPAWWAVGVLAASGTGVAAWGIWKGLAGFPWEREGPDPVERPGVMLGTFVAAEEPAAESMKGRVARLCRGALYGWWSYVLVWAAERVIHLVSRGQPGEELVRLHRGVWVALAIIVGVTAIARLGRYLLRTGAPTSWRGRVRAGVWWIPRFDVVYVGVLAVVGAGLGVPWVLWAVGVPVAVCAGVGVVGAMWALELAPPGRDWWEYCGAWTLRRVARREGTSGAAGARQAGLAK